MKNYILMLSFLVTSTAFAQVNSYHCTAGIDEMNEAPLLTFDLAPSTDKAFVLDSNNRIWVDCQNLTGTVVCNIGQMPANTPPDQRNSDTNVVWAANLVVSNSSPSFEIMSESYMSLKSSLHTNYEPYASCVAK